MSDKRRDSDSEEVEVSKRTSKKETKKSDRPDDDDFDAPLVTKRGGTTTSVMRPRRFEAVFFAKYLEFDRPSEEEIGKFFSAYGTVDHIGYPEGRNFAKIYMSELSTKRETRRTFHTMCQIVQDMDQSERFLIQIAKKKQRPPPRHNNFRGRRPPYGGGRERRDDRRGDRRPDNQNSRFRRY